MTTTPDQDRRSRERAARQEMWQWMQNHPYFTSTELLDTWKEIRTQWNVMHLPHKYYP